MKAPLPANESERLSALRDYAVLDTSPEPAFDRITRVASAVFGVPIALVSLVDEERQWFKSCMGLDACETGRDVSFCAHAIHSDDVMVVTDAREDPRFRENPLVTGPPGIRFYAGAPLESPDGFKIGTLCVIDTTPRGHPNANQLDALVDLAAMVVHELELRLETQELEEAQRAAARLAAIVASSDDAILSKSLHGTVLSWNKGAERLYGYREDEIVGRSISTIVPPEHPNEVADILNRIKRGEAVEHHETVRVRKDGTRVDVSVTISPIRDSKGRIIGASTIARDISERKRLQASLQEAHDKALEASRLKSEFLAVMSHEIRTPMNAVIGMTGLLLDTELNEEQREYAETVRASGETLLTIINDILDFSKIEAGKLEVEIIEFDLRTVVEEVGDMLAERAHRKGLELVTLIEPGVPTLVRGDPGRLRQVLINLTGNAIKFTEKGEVVVRVTVARDTADASLVRFEVADTGIGIEPDKQASLFDAFSQADASTTRAYGGTGLGLAISKQIAELMGGEIGLESERGKGSTFWFTALFEKLANGDLAPRPRKDLVGLRVLIVDDNATNRTILSNQCVSWKMTPATAEGGPQALRMMRAAAEAGEPYDVAILDMNMPEMDGLELARTIAADATLQETRLVLLTSAGVRGTTHTARESGISAFLAKPVRQSHLYDCLVMVTGPEGPTPATMVTRHTLAEATSRSRARVLVVEDNAANQKLAVAMLRKIGYRPDVVGNGIEAVEALSRIRYDAVLMDCQMPEMDGFEATRQIRMREGPGHHTPIVAMTAAAMAGDREACIAAGMDDYICKPVKLDDLEEVLWRWLARNGRAATPSGKTAAPGDGDAIDHGRLAELRALLDGDPAFFADMVTSFLDEVPPMLSALEDAVGRGDGDAVLKLSHNLKGSAASLGAPRLAALARDLEVCVESDDLDVASGLLTDLQAEFDRVGTALKGEVST